MSNFVKKGGLYLPFPKESTTLLVAPSGGGKSNLLRCILQHSELYFAEPISKVVILNHNKHVKFYDLNVLHELEFEPVWPIPSVEEHLLGEFDTINDLEPGTVVIFEDVQYITPVLLDTINLICHHKNLHHVFIVAQSVLGNDIFKLLSLVHRIILFTQNSGILRLAHYICQQFIFCPETKAYLKKILAKSQSNFSTLQIEINPKNYPAASDQQPKYLAISNLQKLAIKSDGYCIIYPWLTFEKYYSDSIFDSSMSVDELNSLFVASVLQQQENHQDTSSLFSAESELNVDQQDISPKFILLHPNHVKSLIALSQKVPLTNSENTTTCFSGDVIRVQDILFEDVDNLIKKEKQHLAKCLVREILKNPDFCISHDGKKIKLKNHSDSTSVGILDYIITATRPVAPAETVHHQEYKQFIALTTSLLDNCSTPKALFKNKILLASPKTQPKKIKPKPRQQHIYPSQPFPQYFPPIPQYQHFHQY